MKTIKISLLTATFFSLGLFMFGCSSAAENRKDAQTDADEANRALEIANKEYLEDIKNYRSEVKLTIAHNDSLIAFHKLRLKKSGMTKNPFYATEIENLEDENILLREKMDNYEGEGKDNWTIFKEEFDHDIKQLGVALEDLSVKNTK